MYKTLIGFVGIFGAIGILLAGGAVLAEDNANLLAQGLGYSNPSAPAGVPAAVGVPVAVGIPVAATESADSASVDPTSNPTSNPANNPAINLTGVWTTTDGDTVTLEQQGMSITGTYEYVDDDDVTQEGRLEGSLKDGVIQAKWWERPKVGGGEEVRGDLQWHVTQDGKMLAGWFREDGDSEQYDWNLKR
jgi:hypothetical protein